MLTTAAATPFFLLLSLVSGEPAPGAALSPQAPATWQPVSAGVETATFALPLAKQGVAADAGGAGRPGEPHAAGEASSALLHVVRIDPAVAELRAHLASEPGERARTAGAWCQEKGLVAAINLGMYKDDLVSNVGYARKAQHRNNSHVNDYRSFLGFGPRREGIPAARLWDAEDAGAKTHLEEYDVVVQNLRLIRGGGTSVWKKPTQRWSEAAIASDRQGRILFLFVGTPVAMGELTTALLALPLDIDRAMHVEGGPEASLSLCGTGAHRDLNGAFRSGVLADVAAPAQMPIPNVIGVAAAPARRPQQDHVTTLRR